MRKNADASATYKKLDDGSWGVWTDLQHYKPGQTISVTTKAGTVRTEKLKEQIWTDGQLSLWSIQERTE